MTTMESIYNISRMKALYLLVLILCFGARLEATAALQSISVPDTLILTPDRKSVV